MGLVDKYMMWRLRRAEAGQERERWRHEEMSFRRPGGVFFELTQRPKITAQALRARAETRPWGTRRLSNLVNTLFESISNPDTNRPYTSSDVAEQSRQREERLGFPVLPLENIEAMREGTPIPFSEGDLLNFCDFFGIDFSYFNDTEAPLSELDPLVAEARRWRAEHPDWPRYRFFVQDLRCWIEERELSVEEVAQETGAIHPEHLKAVLDGRSVAPHEFQEAVGEVMGLPGRVARERWWGRWVGNDLIP